MELPDIRVPTKQDDAFSPFQVSRVFKNIDILIWGRNFGDFNELRGAPRSAGPVLSTYLEFPHNDFST